jgi:hypothetical protein
MKSLLKIYRTEEYNELGDRGLDEAVESWGGWEEEKDMMEGEVGRMKLAVRSNRGI